MLISTILSAIFASTAAAIAFPQDGSCFGCQRGSYCDKYDGDLRFSSNTYYLADRWLSEFGNSGDLASEQGRVICDADWCIELANYGGGNRGYTYEQARLAIEHVKGGDVDGCSSYRQQFIDTGNPDTSDSYLRLTTLSNYYSCDGKDIVDFYGGAYNRFEGPFCGSFA